MKRFEYIKWFWKHSYNDTPVVLFYEINTENERYATRMIEVYNDRRSVPVIEEGFEFITESTIPVPGEINTAPEFFAVNITKEEFEAVYHSDRYDGDISFPAKETR